MQVISVSTKKLDEGVLKVETSNDYFRHKKMEGGYDITGREDEFFGAIGLINDPVNVVVTIQDNGAKSFIHRALLVDWLTEKCVEKLGTFQKASLGDVPPNVIIEKMAQIASVIVVVGEKYSTKPFYPAQQKMLDDSGFMYVPQ